MSDHERKELVPCVIIKEYDNSSDSDESSDESIMLDATSKQFTGKYDESRDESSVVVSSIPLKANERNDEFHDNHKSMKSRPNNEEVTMSGCEKTTIGNVTHFLGPVVIKKCIYDYSNIVEETISDHDTETMIAHSSETEVNKIRWSRISQCLVLLILAVLLASAIYFTINYFVAHAQSYARQQNDSVEEIDYSHDNEQTTVELQFSFKFRIISRSEWQAQKPKSLMDLRLPAMNVIIAHTVTNACSTQEYCILYIRSMQTYHINSGLGDIKYNFLVGGDGSAYIGRGWDKEGAFSNRFNRNSICISFIGTFTDRAPPQQQITAAQKLIEESVRLKKLIPGYQLYGHSQVSNTASPGKVLYAIIQKWDHWSDTVR